MEWEHSQTSTSYAATLEIEAFDRLALLKDIISQVTDTKTNIRDIKIRQNNNTSSAIIRIDLDIQDINHLSRVKQAINQISDVFSVKRLAS